MKKNQKTITTTNTPLHAAHNTNNGEDSIDNEEGIFYDALDQLPTNKHTASDKQTTHKSTTAEDEDIFYDALTVQQQIEQSAQKVNWTIIQDRVKAILGDQFAALAQPEAILSLTISNAIWAGAASFLGINFLPTILIQTGFYTASTTLNTLIKTLQNFDDPSLNQYINHLQKAQRGLSLTQLGLLATNALSALPNSIFHTGISIAASTIIHHFVTPLAQKVTPTLTRGATAIFKSLNHSNPQKVGHRMANIISIGTSSGIIQATTLIFLANQMTQVGGSPVSSYASTLPSSLAMLNGTTTPTASTAFNASANVNTSTTPASTFNSWNQTIIQPSTTLIGNSTLAGKQSLPTTSSEAFVNTNTTKNSTTYQQDATPTPHPSDKITRPNKSNSHEVNTGLLQQQEATNKVLRRQASAPDNSTNATSSSHQQQHNNERYALSYA